MVDNDEGSAPNRDDLKYGNGDFVWWDLGDPELWSLTATYVMRISFGEFEGATWDEFRNAQPALAYAYTVALAYKSLEDSIVALRPIQKFLAARKLPIGTPRGSINRAEWLRMILDVFLFRSTGVRDHCLHLVHDVFELGLPHHLVNLKRVVRHELLNNEDEIKVALERIARVGPEHRVERNERAHQGLQRQIVENWTLFEAQSMTEQAASRTTGDERDGPDIASVFAKAADDMEEEFFPAISELVEATTHLVRLLAAPFEAKYAVKST